MAKKRKRPAAASKMPMKPMMKMPKGMPMRGKMAAKSGYGRKR